VRFYACKHRTGFVSPNLRRSHLHSPSQSEPSGSRIRIEDSITPQVCSYDARRGLASLGVIGFLLVDAATEL